MSGDTTSSSSTVTIAKTFWVLPSDIWFPTISTSSSGPVGMVTVQNPTTILVSQIRNTDGRTITLKPGGGISSSVATTQFMGSTATVTLTEAASGGMSTKGIMPTSTIDDQSIGSTSLYRLDISAGGWSDWDAVQRATVLLSALLLLLVIIICFAWQFIEIKDAKCSERAYGVRNKDEEKVLVNDIKACESFHIGMSSVRVWIKDVKKRLITRYSTLSNEGRHIVTVCEDTDASAVISPIGNVTGRTSIGLACREGIDDNQGTVELHNKDKRIHEPKWYGADTLTTTDSEDTSDRNQSLVV